jgi:hypothetical protein
MRTLSIFISSTMKDLEDERNAVDEVIKELDFHTIRAETRGSVPASPMEECKKMVLESDIYLGIFGGRYGYMPDEKKSILKRGFDWARETRKKYFLPFWEVNTITS